MDKEIKFLISLFFYFNTRIKYPLNSKSHFQKLRESLGDLQGPLYSDAMGGFYPKSCSYLSCFCLFGFRPLFFTKKKKIRPNLAAVPHWI